MVISLSASSLGEPDGESGWAEIARDGCRFGVDAAWVLGLRSLRLAGGGKDAGRELALMVAEKCYGHAAYANALASGRFGRSPRSITASTIAYYGQWVRDNRRRLAGKD